MMLMVSSLADSILVRQELLEELAYECLGKVIDRLCAGVLTVLVGIETGLWKCKCWGPIPVLPVLYIMWFGLYTGVTW